MILTDKIKEKRIAFFIKGHRKEIKEIQKIFVDIFNECGTKYNNSAMQLALAGGIVLTLLKCTNMPKEEVKKLLDNLAKKFK